MFRNDLCVTTAAFVSKSLDTTSIRTKHLIMRKLSQREVECSQWAVHRCVLATQAALILKFPAQPPGSSKSCCKYKSTYKTITKQCRQTDTSCSQTTYRPIITGCHFSLASKRMRKIIVVLQIQTNL